MDVHPLYNRRINQQQRDKTMNVQSIANALNLFDKDYDNAVQQVINFLLKGDRQSAARVAAPYMIDLTEVSEEYNINSFVS